MSAERAVKERLIDAGTELVRRNGYVATTVDGICAEAGVTKGAFFHHFPNKEALANSCLRAWGERIAAMEGAASFRAAADPVARALGCMDFYIELFRDPKLRKSCLAGTTVQEVAETHPVLRDAANACFTSAAERFKGLLDDAARSRRKRLDTASLAKLWIAALQGSIILGKASRDDAVISESLEHVRRYVAMLLGPKRSR
jgi:TetR/AcrR family transcriptional regulator, transcriptional repressor for nem operon